MRPCRIILDVAKGLCSLHEECRQKIAHLDIKPQNILLDDNFNAKVADFGLCKLINRDQSKVVTMMRGTPGYLAPEWLTSWITEKVDFYTLQLWSCHHGNSKWKKKILTTLSLRRMFSS